MHRFKVALKWAGSAATLAFIVTFLTPLAIGGPGAHQAPLVAFLVTPIIFVVTLERSVSVKMWHYASDGPFLYASRHRLEVERLALEVVRQMDALGRLPETRSPAR